LRLLVVHQNFPGQFRHLLADWSRRPGWAVVGLGRDSAPGLPPQPGLQQLRYLLHRGVHEGQHRYLRRMEDAVLHGQATARAMLALQRRGWTPDVIVAHPGWGETLYAKEVFPKARLVHFCEWFYRTEGADMGFDAEFPLSFDDRARVTTWNALHLLNLSLADALVSPTQWQADQHPAPYRERIQVIHEGIQLDGLAPDPAAQFSVDGGPTFRVGDPLLTYVARNLEPYRGFHVLMRTLPELQRRHPEMHTVLVGGDEVSYGRKPEGAASWRAKLLAELDGQLDLSRLHFVGRVPYARYQQLLQVSRAHVYLSYPFVASWSLLEAQALGARLVVSDTAPVREVVEGCSNCRRFPFFDRAALADAVSATWDQPVDTAAQACDRANLARYALSAALKRWDGLLGL
jgi:glycosyltransferase involved in cell wall biosynthesis